MVDQGAYIRRMELDSGVKRRLEEEAHTWMTTVRPDGTPQSSLVWFLWDGEEMLIYSRESSRVRNLEENPRVSLNFNSNDRGGAVATFTADAAIDRTRAPAFQNEAYVAKYAAHIPRIGKTPESFSEAYPVPIVARLRSMRAWGN